LPIADLWRIADVKKQIGNRKLAIGNESASRLADTLRHLGIHLAVHQAWSR
jgi:signal recognition particle subunit SEC65